MEAHYVILTILDFDELGADGVREVIENTHYPNRCISPDIVSIQTADIGEWSDDHPLNNSRTAPTELMRLFPLTADAEQMRAELARLRAELQGEQQRAEAWKATAEAAERALTALRAEHKALIDAVRARDELAALLPGAGAQKGG